LGKLHSACHYFFLSNIILLKSRRGKCRGGHNQLLRPSPPPRVNFPPGVVPDTHYNSSGRKLESGGIRRHKYYESPKKEIVSHTFEHLIYNIKIYNGVKI